MLAVGIDIKRITGTIHPDNSIYCVATIVHPEAAAEKDETHFMKLYSAKDEIDLKRLIANEYYWSKMIEQIQNDPEKILEAFNRIEEEFGYTIEWCLIGK